MRLFGVAYAVTAALAVYRIVKDMRTYYMARRAHATTRKTARYMFNICLGYTVVCGQTGMTGCLQFGRYHPVVYITDWTMSNDIVKKVNALIDERLGNVTMKVSNTNAAFCCHIFARCTESVQFIFGKSDDRYIQFNDETSLPADLVPCCRSAKKALAGLPKRIYL